MVYEVKKWSPNDFGEIAIKFKRLKPKLKQSLKKSLIYGVEPYGKRQFGRINGLVNEKRWGDDIRPTAESVDKALWLAARCVYTVYALHLPLLCGQIVLQCITILPIVTIKWLPFRHLNEVLVHHRQSTGHQRFRQYWYCRYFLSCLSRCWITSDPTGRLLPGYCQQWLFLRD